MTTTDPQWLLEEPSVRLTPGEREWFEWAVAGAQDVLGDEGWLEDNEDALTVAGQIEDLRYRLETQGYDVTKGVSTEQAKVGVRTLNSLNKKLRESGYWNEDFHG